MTFAGGGIDHPALPYERSVRELRTRARIAVGALGVTMLARAWDIGGRAWSIALLKSFVAADEVGQASIMGDLESADRLVNFGAIVINSMLLVTAIAFLFWVHRLVTLTRALGGQGLRWTPGQAVWGFLIPILSLVRPFQVLRDVQQALEPEEIESPAPRVDPSALTDYRSVALVMPPAAKELPRFFIGAWWGSFVMTNLVSRLATIGTFSKGAEGVIWRYDWAIVAGVLAVVAAGLAIRVVRGLTARLDERFRRIRHSTPEALAAQQIEIEPHR